MDIKKYEQAVVEKVERSLEDYLATDSDCGYSKGHVKECKALIFDYLGRLEKLSPVTDEKIMAEVRSLVLALNKLNEKTDYCLIETDAREEIWEIIQNSAVECGLKDAVDDVTEEWREW